MLGWDFSPRLSGGVGSACQGLAQALARAGHEIRFVLPRLRGDEDPRGVELVAGASEPAPPAPPAHAPALEPAASPPATPAHAPPRERVSPVARAAGLRMLAIDSPLRPYQTAGDYERLMRRLRAEARDPRGAAPHSPVSPAHAPTPPGNTARAPRPRPEPARAEQVPALPATPYRETLFDEVERYARSVRSIATERPPDLIHAHDWVTFPAGLLAREATGKPLVCHFHSCEIERQGAQADPRILALEQAALERADRIVCVSHRSERTLREHFSLDWARVRVVHNAFSPPGGVPAERDGAELLVLHLGRLVRQKSPQVFLEAARRVHEHEPRARFVIAGAGELLAELTARADELGLEDVVRFTGFLAGEELARTYARAQAYVLSSASEPFGITPLEAASMGVPVIVPETAGVTEVLQSCLCFDPGDADDLAEQILAVLHRPELRATLVRDALAEVRELRWERPARELGGIYDELVRG